MLLNVSASKHQKLHRLLDCVISITQVFPETWAGGFLYLRNYCKNSPCTEETGKPRGISRGRDESSSRRYSDEGPRTILRSERPTLPAAISEEPESPSYRFWMRQPRDLEVPLSKFLVQHFHWEPQDGLFRTGYERISRKRKVPEQLQTCVLLVSTVCLHAPSADLCL